MTTSVIDLSHHNTIPQSLIPAKQSGIHGVIHKATEGSYFVDKKLAARRYLASEAQMLFGVYHFIRPGDMGDQADFFVEQAQQVETHPGDMFHWLWALDYEDPAVSLLDCDEFLSHLSELLPGNMPVIYSGHVLKDKIAAGEPLPASFPQLRLWLAQYSTTPVLPEPWETYWLWQFTDTGTVPGINGNVDLNDYQGSEAQLANEWAGRMVPPVQQVVRITVEAPSGVAVEVNGMRLP